MQNTPSDPQQAVANPGDTGRQQASRRITLIGAAVDGSLGIGKLTVGYLANSQALIADGIHSLSDLATDIGVLIAAHMAAAAPDRGHPYGHARFETLATLGLGAVLLLVAGGLAQDSLTRLVSEHSSVPGIAALVMAAVSILAKEWIYRRTARVAQSIGSNLLLANAWHSRSDALSSVAVLVGVGGAMAGWPWMDLIAALVVAGMIAWIGWGLLAQAARELVDSGLPAEEVAAMRLVACSIPGVLDVQQLKSRRMGNEILLDLDILVQPDRTVSEGHQLAWQVQQDLRKHFPGVRAVQVHVDSAFEATSRSYPAPHVAEATLLTCWQDLLPNPSPRLALHYGSNGIRVDLYLRSKEPPPDMLGLQRRLVEAARHEAWLDSVRVWWSP